MSKQPQSDVIPGDMNSLVRSARGTRDYAGLKAEQRNLQDISNAAGITKIAAIGMGAVMLAAGAAPLVAAKGFVFAATMQGAIEGGKHGAVLVEQDQRGQLAGTRHEGISQARSAGEFVRNVLPVAAKEGAKKSLDALRKPFSVNI